MINVYCLSGLAADEKILAKLKVEGYNFIYLPWLPNTSTDDMKTYAMRMAGLIKEENPILLGMSFGGMLVTEIANHLPVKKAFVISGSKTISELPTLLVMNKWLIGMNMIPSFAFKMANPIVYHYVGAETVEEHQLISTMMNNAKGEFIGWAIKAMANWQNKTFSDKIVHIHGTDDKLITPESIKANYWIKDGTHLMVYNRAEEINAILNKELNSGNNL